MANYAVPRNEDGIEQPLPVGTPVMFQQPSADDAGFWDAPDAPVASTLPPGETAESFGSLVTPWGGQLRSPEFTPPAPFTAPTDVTMQNDPGWQFRLKQGLQALQNSAAAKGTLLTGGTLKGLQDYAQQFASGEYGNVWNRALTEQQNAYGQASNTWQHQYNRALGEYQTAYDTFNRNQQWPYTVLAGLSGYGQNTANTLGALGQNYAGLASNTLMGAAGQQGEYATQGANATAAGQVGAANAWNAGIAGIGNAAQNAYLSYLLNQQKPGQTSYMNPYDYGYGQQSWE